VQLLLVQAEVSRVLGDHAAAVRALDRAGEVLEKLGNLFLDGLIHAERGRLALAQGDHPRAEQHLHTALGLQVSIGARPAAVRTLEVMAAIAALDESFAESAHVLSAADGLLQQIGLARGPLELAAYDAQLQLLRVQLSDAMFDTEWNDARGISLTDVVEYVSRMRGQRKRPSVGWDCLTPTELRVAALVAEGLTHAQIGARMFIARGTAKIHVAHIFTKLGIGSRAQLAVMAAGRSR
jgi:ATP/maltotriose-dependent transcriptional regulator MalT